MTPVDWFAVISGWILIGGFVGLITGVEMENSARFPDGAAPALGITAGLLWPLTVLLFAGWLSWRVARTLARSFAVLWSATAGEWLVRRAAMVRVPKMRVRR